jgi:hypothetical protein
LVVPVLAAMVPPAPAAANSLPNEGLELIEIADGVSIDDVRLATGADFRVADGYRSRWLKPMGGQ